MSNVYWQEPQFLVTIHGLTNRKNSQGSNGLSQLAQLDDSGLVMDTEALQEDIRNLRREWMRLFELGQGLGIFLNQMYRYRIEESIREIEKKIREV